MTDEAKKEMSFEAGMARLEKLIEQMESGKLDLDDSMKFFEEGVRLSRELNAKLDDAEKRLEILARDAQGKPVAEELNLGLDEDVLEED